MEGSRVHHYSGYVYHALENGILLSILVGMQEAHALEYNLSLSKPLLYNGPRDQAGHTLSFCLAYLIRRNIDLSGSMLLMAAFSDAV